MPTFRVTYDPRPGVRLLIEDIEADAVRETPAHIELTLDMLVVGQPGRSSPCAHATRT